MRRRLGWLRDPTFHLIAVLTGVLGVVVGSGSASWRSSHDDKAKHPAKCHACSLCPPEVAEARDAFLIRTGSIAPPDASE